MEMSEGCQKVVQSVSKMSEIVADVSEVGHENVRKVQAGKM